MSKGTAESDAVTPSGIARGLIRNSDRAVMSTIMAGGGWPYGSLVLTACDHSARPLLLISDLAEHSRNLAADARAALLFDGTAGLASPLTGARVTVLGRLERCNAPDLAGRYVARHPDAGMYRDFADFHFYRMDVERAHLVAGFGSIQWIPGEELLFDVAGFADLAPAEKDIVEHMNEDHADAVALYATALLDRPPGDWIMTGIDPEGMDLRAGGSVARLAFAEPVRDAATARAALVASAKAARAHESH